MLEGKVDGKRGRGRRRKSWSGNVSKMTKMSMAQCSVKALDRSEWRTMVPNLYAETRRNSDSLNHPCFASTRARYCFAVPNWRAVFHLFVSIEIPPFVCRQQHTGSSEFLGYFFILFRWLKNDSVTNTIKMSDLMPSAIE